MTDALYAFLSNEWSGLAIALILLVAALLVHTMARAKLLKWPARIAMAVAVILAVGAASHLYRVAQIDEAYPAPGRMVDVGGYEMHIIADGPTGAPPIVWFAGGHSSGYSLLPLHEDLAKTHRSLLIDRPGTGWSDAGPFPRTTAREADEVMRALDAADEAGPYVFAGHSFGGLLAANIARRYPDRTAAVVLLDPTPLDVVFYGLDRSGLGSFATQIFARGLRQLFGFYRVPDLGDTPLGTTLKVEHRAGSSFPSASIMRELNAEGLIERAFETTLFDGELGDTLLYLIAPKNEPGIGAYAKTVAGEDASRFEAFLHATRERYLAASTRSKRIVTPENTTHNFPSEVPEFVVATIRDIVQALGEPAELSEDVYQSLTHRWPGPYGGVPPVDLATPERIDAAFRRAVEEKRAEIRAIVENPDAPSFENTIVALEASGIALSRIQSLLQIFTSTVGGKEYGAIAGPLTALKASLDDAINHDSALFTRVDDVFRRLPDSAPDPEGRRLVEVTHRRLVRSGAGLSPEDKSKLRAINARLAELRTQFVQNAQGDEAALAVFVKDEERLQGLPQERIDAARKVAEEKGRTQQWAIPAQRPAVWPVLTYVDDRPLRETVWRQWVGRGGNDGERDNAPVMTEILRLRGEKSALLGFPSFAHYQTAGRMAETPENALQMLEQAWELLLPVTEAEIAAMQELADGEGLNDELMPWDRLYYAEKLKQRRFQLSAADVMPYLTLDNVVDAMIWAAGKVYEFDFVAIDDIPVVSNDIRVFEVRRNGEVVGVIWMDLYARQGKGPASWAVQYRSAASFNADQLPLVALHSAVQKPSEGDTAQLPWERANVIFHEFGHTIHTLSNATSYPSLGPLNLPWDFIEVPSLLNERWLLDPKLLSRFALHVETGKPIPGELIERIKAAQKFDRPFSATLNYLAAALVDMRLHLKATGETLDAQAEEASILAEIGVPRAIDLTLYTPHAFHTFSEQYAAGVYTYLWSDVLAADIAEVFFAAPGRLYDDAVAKRYRDVMLDPAHSIEVAEAFKTFRGREPTLDAFLERNIQRR